MRISPSLLAGIWLTGCGAEPLHLVPERAIQDDTIPYALTDEPGDPQRGEAIFIGRDEGHCVLCHQVADLDAPFQGTVGPNLTGVGLRLTPEQIRLRIVDASRLNPNTIMPPYYRINGLTQVGTGYQGQPVLSAEAIEDLVAYLSSLQGAPL